MTVLSVVQRACAEIGINVPTTVFNNSNESITQLRYLVETIGQELMRSYNWENLTREGSFTTVATESQGLLTTAASDFQRFINQTMYDRDRTWEMVGPISDQEWQYLKGTVAQSVQNFFRIRQGTILFNPAPPAGNTVYFEYITNKWCESSGGTGQTALAADTDVFRIDEEVVRALLVARFLERKGLDYAEPFRRAQELLTNARMRDGGKPQISMNGRRRGTLNLNVPEGSWDL